MIGELTQLAHGLGRTTLEGPFWTNNPRLEPVLTTSAQNTNPKRQTNKTVGRTWTRAGLKFYVPGATLFLLFDPSYSTPIPQHFHRKMYFATGKHIFFVRLQVSYSPLLRTYSANTCMKMCIVLWRNAIFSTGRGVDVCKKLEFQLETCIVRRKHPF